MLALPVEAVSARAVQPLKAAISTNFTVSLKISVWRDVQPSNAWEPIVVTESVIVTFSIKVNFAKCASGFLVTVICFAVYQVVFVAG